MATTLHIPETRSTPEVHFDPTTGICLIRGRSIPADATTFFAPLDRAFETLITSESKTPISIHIRLEHLNTGTIRCLLNIFAKLLRIRSQGVEVSFEWYYESADDDLVDKGEEMALILDVPFTFISFTDENY